MCLILFAYDQTDDHSLILIANRDEFYDRPTTPARYWDDDERVFAGRDQVGGGTWLGVTRTGRFAAVTNYRDPSAPNGSRSRGELALDFLTSDEPAAEYLAQVQRRTDEYSGFNLLVGEFESAGSALFYLSNRGQGVRQLTTGNYGLSNHLLDTPWPKIVRGKRSFAELIKDGAAPKEKFFELLADQTVADDDRLPSTGVTLEQERALSPIFIKTPGYGTRCSTFLRFDRKGEWEFEERVFV
ncbi:MAG: NRDE family protein [Pyrinomonadaceae bacterium]